MRTIKIISVTAVLAALFIVAAMASVAARNEGDDPFDAATTYKSKCLACHGAKADKKFDNTKAEADHVQVILKGKKMEKPPNMPGYEEKGITEEQAKALVAHMKQLQSAQ